MIWKGTEKILMEPIKSFTEPWWKILVSYLTSSGNPINLLTDLKNLKTKSEDVESIEIWKETEKILMEPIKSIMEPQSKILVS